MKINEQEKKTPTGFHAIKGNDFISSFFEKGKRKLVETVKCLGNSWDVSEALFIDIEEYICKNCQLYKKKKLFVLLTTVSVGITSSCKTCRL